MPAKRTPKNLQKPPTKNIVWIASYPKSGNTWLRMFLGNYFLSPTTPMSINRIHQLGLADSTARMYRAAASGRFDSTDPMQALQLRAKVLRGIVSNGADVNFVKTHNLRDQVFGVDLIPTRLTRSAIYIIRDPHDVVVSYARHFGRTIEATVASIGSHNTTTAGRGDTVKQFLGSWSDHVRGWTRTRDFPVLALRYEDMRADPQTAFAKALKHIGAPVDNQRLQRAIRFSSFDELQKQEAAEPFVERSNNAERFFHTGTSGQWRGVMAEAQIEQICRDHGPMMREFGYLDG